MRDLPRLCRGAARSEAGQDSMQGRARDFPLNP